MPTTPTASGPIVEYQSTPVLSNGQELPIFNQFLPIREVTTNDEINAHNVYRPFNLLETVFNMEPQGSFDNIFRDDEPFATNSKRFVFGMGTNFNNSNNIIQNPVANVFDINVARANISALASHLGVSTPASLDQQVTTNSTVRAQDWNDVILTARDCWNHRFDSWKTAIVVDGPTHVMRSRNRGVSFRFNFSSVQNMLRFFIAGGAIGLQFVSPHVQTSLWDNIFNIAGTVRLSGFRVDVNEELDLLDTNIRSNYEVVKTNISNSFGGYDGNIIRFADRTFYDIDLHGTTRLCIDVGVFEEHGYSCVILEPQLFVYTSGSADSRSIVSKVWQPSFSASFLPNFENPTVTTYPDFLQDAPLSFRQP